MDNNHLLATLFGNKSIEKILFFLLVNEKTYATQLHRITLIPLSALQKALSRLEAIGLLKSEYTGKTRCYMFNSQYPLLQELEQLLKRAYSLLSPREKSLFYSIRQASGSRKANQNLLFRIWERLRNINQVVFQFRSQKGGEGIGRGEVLVEDRKDGKLIFRENGTWRGLNHQEFNFRNVFRWTLNWVEGFLTLEHLRFGIQNPVFLFHLVPASEKSLESVDAHLCGQDTYFGQIFIKPIAIDLSWRVLGPHKNDEIIYSYS